MLLALKHTIEYNVKSLKRLRIVLASGSPRRKEILTSLFNEDGTMFEVITSSFEENLDKNDFQNKPDLYSLATCEGKVKDVIKALKNEDNNLILVIGADTVVEKDGKIIEKPSNPAHNMSILKSLAGSYHSVYTSVVVYKKENDLISSIFHFTTCTKVRMVDLNDEAISAYVATGEGKDKAGGYGIQGLGRCLIDRIDGDFYNVMGFPACDFTMHFAKEIKKMIKDNVLKEATSASALVGNNNSPNKKQKS